MQHDDRIPDEFITRFGNELTNVAKITVPDGQYMKLKVPFKLQNLQGKQWDVSCILNNKQSSSMRIMKGLPIFARENNLLKRHFYVFELIKTKPVVVLQVTPSRTKIPDNFITIFGNELNNVAKVTVPGGRYIDADFAKKYLKPDVGVKLKNCNGEQWEIYCTSNDFRSSALRMGRGFTEFLTDNNLSDGDKCKFELIKKIPVVLKLLSVSPAS
ncbi:hypothetical protein TSUD_227690 [Trifolium subterraneum]|uniref:TF-B3 domain-containing protein n=1 Tax=Trifolium subterraneum TaxID=3900 RepID=A0A2Z6LXV0_TRISU|nr:hypothetical protein TSUD_227690 [Trifolium subterraneum]